MARDGLGIAATGFALLALGCGAAAEPAIPQFELKDLDNEVGRIEFQSQNAHSFGQPRRRFLATEPGEVAYDDNAVVRQRHALEIEMTVSRFHRMRLGIEYENERIDDPPSPSLADAYTGLDLTEVAIESVFILKPLAGDGIGFGALVEYEHPLAPGELNSVVMGPIVQAQWGAWSATANLFLVKHFGNGERTAEGVERDDKWDFAYAAQLMYRASERWALAVEGYGTIDRLGASGAPTGGALLFGDHDQHRLGPIVYYTFGLDAGAKGRTVKGVATEDDGGDDADEVEVTIGVGALIGLNDNTPDATLKWSVEVEF